MRRLDARSMGPVFLYLCWSFSELASSIYHTQSCSAAVTSCFLSSLCLLLLRLPLLLPVTVVRWEPSKMQVDHCHAACSCWPALGSHWKTDTKRAEANMKRCTWTWVPFQLLDLLHTTKKKKKSLECRNGQPTNHNHICILWWESDLSQPLALARS